MSEHSEGAIDWVVLTTGDRPGPLHAALSSLCADLPAADAGGAGEVVLVANGAGSSIEGSTGTCARVVACVENLGVPGGRDAGMRACTAEVVGFLDDDAVLEPGGSARIAEEFRRDERLGAVALRVVDEGGAATRRHVPRIGGAAPSTSTDVVHFVGCAHALRRAAYEDVGGYFTELFYSHEEIELCWRLIDAGWRVRYLADVGARHPRTEISRHARGWELTGRNRVLIARRTLPWPIAVAHVLSWLVLGLVRAPGGTRSSYLRGWWSGWRRPVDRRPIAWATVWRLGRLGRFPVV
jgi:hypothetical protein